MEFVDRKMVEKLWRKITWWETTEKPLRNRREITDETFQTLKVLKSQWESQSIAENIRNGNTLFD